MSSIIRTTKERGKMMVDIYPPAIRSGESLSVIPHRRGKFIIDIHPPLFSKAEMKIKKAKKRRAASFPGAKSLSLILILTLNAAFINSVGTAAAFYMDTETSSGNTFIAGKVDFVLASTPYSLPQTAVSLMQGMMATRTITVVPEIGSNPFWYHASTSNFGLDQDFCTTLLLDSFLEGTANYSGPLADFLSPATTTLDDWQFDISTNVNSYNKICVFDFDFNAWQERHNLPGYDEMGFSDTEKETNKIASKGFRLNKLYYDVEDVGNNQIPNLCPALSKGYWANNEGCSQGTGSANWNDEVNTLSTNYSSLFATTTGAVMCASLWVPNCPSAGTVAGKLCRAKAHTLADEMNVVSGKLDLNAIISGADDGNSAFDSLGLTPLSTIGEALASIETVLASTTASGSKINKAGYVAERIYTFYEDENMSAPYCVYSDSSALNNFRGVEIENEWVELYNQTDSALDITGWSICDNTSCDLFPTTDPIPSLGYALVTASSTTSMFWDFASTMPVILLPDSSIGNGLNNDNDMLLLKRPDGVIVDQMNYGPDPDAGWNNYNSDIWDPGAVDVEEGNTLARNPSGYDTDQPSDWVELAVPEIILTYPGLAESEGWSWGETRGIDWVASNPNGPDSELSIDIYLILDIDQTETITPPDTIEPIVIGTANDGHHDFIVPDGFTGYVWIKIVATGPENPMLNDIMTSGKVWDPPRASMSAAEIKEAIEEKEEELEDAETVGDGTLDPEILASVVSDALELSAREETQEEITLDEVVAENTSSTINNTETAIENTIKSEENFKEIMDFDLLREEEDAATSEIISQEGDAETPPEVEASSVSSTLDSAQTVEVTQGGVLGEINGVTTVEETELIPNEVITTEEVVAVTEQESSSESTTVSTTEIATE